MVDRLLQNILNNIQFENLPSNWTAFNLKSFSKIKELWPPQQQALQNAIIALWKYYDDFNDYNINENPNINQIRKQQFIKLYNDNGLLEGEMDIAIKNDNVANREITNLLEDYYSSKTEQLQVYERTIFNYEHFINRMSFWMATGSGKTIVIVKFIQILKELMNRDEIPKNDILFLTYRQDLIEQFKKSVNEFNESNSYHIHLIELCEYEETKRQLRLLREKDIVVFYYRSDIISDKQGEKILDFRNFDNNGQWFTILDEAHKGDPEDSKRQQLFSIISRNGFLFNFSATFVDFRNVITCAFEFNLSSYINDGYGKHLAILKQETKAFADKEDYSNIEKQKIILKSLILLTYAKKIHSKIQKINSNLYHNPMLLTLVGSVNTEEADLKLFFRELIRIGKFEIDMKLFNTALQDLWIELKEKPEFKFEIGRNLVINKELFHKITYEDILRFVFNSKTAGSIEVLLNPANTKELAFKLKTSNQPFALIKIGDIANWIKQELEGYEIQKKYEDESFFENLNKDDSTINILMGSRAFYEGWDSNRPNLITYINIGSVEAHKFVLQSIGRGVRIEPVAEKRRRLVNLYNNNEIDESLFSQIKDLVLPVETLIIMGVDRLSLLSIIEELNTQTMKLHTTNLELSVNIEEIKNKLLLFPMYKLAEKPLVKSKEILKFEIHPDELSLLKNYLNYISDDRILLVKYDVSLEKISVLRECLANSSKYFKETDKKYLNIDLLMKQIFNYFSVVPEEFHKINELFDEISHFKKIQVYLEDVKELFDKIAKVKNFPQEEKLKEQLRKQEISIDNFTEKIKNISSHETFEYEGIQIQIKCLEKHYYIPLILSLDERIKYINHIIKVESERKFVNQLENYLKQGENKFSMFDWWMFSKIDETTDKIFIPYYNTNLNKISHFYPDFIFWFKKGNDYNIVFVDPKGTEHVEAYRKIDGYKELFEENNNPKVIKYKDYNVKISILIKPDDIARIIPEYRNYSFDVINDMFKFTEIKY